MSVDLYENKTSDVPVTSDSSFFRALKFVYTNEARTATKKVWLRNNGDTAVSGHLYVNRLNAITETGPPVLGLDPVEEETFSIDRVLSSTDDGYGWSCFPWASPLPSVHDGTLHFTPGALGFIGKEMFSTLTYVSSIAPTQTFRWKLKSKSYLTNASSIAIGKYNGNPGSAGVNVTGGRGLYTEHLGGGIWLIQVCASSSGNFPPSGATPMGSGTWSQQGSEGEIKALIDGACLDLVMDTYELFPGFFVDRMNFKITMSNGDEVYNDVVYHSQNGMNGVFTSTVFDGFEVDYWGYGDPTEEPGEEVIVGYEGIDTWFKFAQDFGNSPGAWTKDQLISLEPGEQKPVWIKLTVPLSSSPTQKIDLRIKATYS